MAYYIPTLEEVRKNVSKALEILPCQCCGAKRMPGEEWTASTHLSPNMHGLELPLCTYCGHVDPARLSLEDVREAIRLRLKAIREGASIYCSGLHLLEQQRRRALGDE